MLLNAKNWQNTRDSETAPEAQVGARDFLAPTSITLYAHNVQNPSPAFKMLTRSSAKASQVIEVDSAAYKTSRMLTTCC